MGKKRAHQPGYTQKIGRNGKKYWARNQPSCSLPKRASVKTPIVFKQGMSVNGHTLSYVETNVFGSKTSVFGSFLDSKENKFISDDDKFHFYIIENEKGKYLKGEELYIPKQLQGQGFAKAFVQLQEQYAIQEGATKARRTPGNRNGAVFWTMQGYDWEHEIPGNILSDLITMNYYLTDNSISFRHGQEKFRFEKIQANYQNMLPFKNQFAEYAELAEDIMWNDNNTMFYAKDLLNIGKERSFEDENGVETWAGKVFLTNAGSWAAWKHF